MPGTDFADLSGPIPVNTLFFIFAACVGVFILALIILYLFEKYGHSGDDDSYGRY